MNNPQDPASRAFGDAMAALGLLGDGLDHPSGEQLDALLKVAEELAVVHELATRRLAQREEARGLGECPGCVGRGTGSVCCACGRPIPQVWRRSAESPSDVRADCLDCQAGRVHAHHGGAR